MEIIAGKQPYFSVIIDTYNYGCFIEQAVESVLDQTFPRKDTQIIVVDDGSTDDTAGRLGKYKGEVEYIYKKNGGQASALNAGFYKACGKVICFLDADDYWYADKLESVAGEFSRSDNMDVVYNYMDIIDSRDKVIGELADKRGDILFNKYPMAGLLKGSMPFNPETSVVSVKAACLKNIMALPEDIRICADGYVNMLLPFYAKEYSIIRKALGAYRVHEHNLWKGKALTEDMVKMRLCIVNLIVSGVEQHGAKLNLDISLVKERMKAAITESKISLYRSQGRKLRAFIEAMLSWHSFPEDASPGLLNRIMKKIYFLICSPLSERQQQILNQRINSGILLKVKNYVKNRH
ncbi:MAG: glycosyltransferase [Candidatus Omnitrophica bacterium]|nr:glycosyltransferase [Candidatus Omnitrophota bacterium]